MHVGILEIQLFITNVSLFSLNKYRVYMTKIYKERENSLSPFHKNGNFFYIDLWLCSDYHWFNASIVKGIRIVLGRIFLKIFYFFFDFTEYDFRKVWVFLCEMLYLLPSFFHPFFSTLSFLSFFLIQNFRLWE